MSPSAACTALKDIKQKAKEIIATAEAEAGTGASKRQGRGTKKMTWDHGDGLGFESLTESKEE
jgi:hypothetical protein